MAMLIKDSQIVSDDTPILEAGYSGELPQHAAIVPLDFWNTNKEALKARSDIGIWLDSHDEPEALVDDLATIAVIAINFPKFADGRGYSYARLLRERFGYEGEIRAIGDVLQDQLFYMKRCGFNAFAVREDKNIEQALASLGDFSNSYQAACDNPSPLFRRRA